MLLQKDPQPIRSGEEHKKEMPGPLAKPYPFVKKILPSKAIVALVLLILIECVIFRTSLYREWLKPNSFAGMLMLRCRLATTEKLHASKIVAVVGDSRVREGFSPKDFDLLASSSGLKALNLGVSGSTPRVWHYLLKYLDPHCNAFSSIVIALPSYADEDYGLAMSTNKQDNRLLLPILTLVDIAEFVQSFPNQSDRQDIFLSSILKFYGYRHDIQDFLSHPLKRLDECKFFREKWPESEYAYTGRDSSLAGIGIRRNEIFGLPERMNSTERDRLHIYIFPPPRQAARLPDEYFAKWLGLLVSRYKNSNTKIIFIRMPTLPLPVQTNNPSTILTMNLLSKEHHVIVDPADSFRSLEKPQFFYDDVHLNMVARHIFSKELTRKVVYYLNSKRARSMPPFS